MLVIAYTLLAAAVACALYQRARRKAAEWDRDAAQTEADRLERALFGARTYSGTIISERDQNALDLAACRRELETLRGHQEQVSRAHGDAQRNAAIGRIEALARIKKIADLARESDEFLS